MSNRKFPPGDRHNSTYRMRCRQPQRDTPFVGYSKLVGHNEHINKEILLEKYIERMLNNGYLERSYLVEFLTNRNIGDNYDDVLVSLDLEGYELYGDAKLHPFLDDMLKRFYANRKNKDPNSQIKIYSNRKRTDSQDDFFNTKLKFNNKQELRNYYKKAVELFGDEIKSRAKGYCYFMIEHLNLQE
jgi:hypothetical protein